MADFFASICGVFCICCSSSLSIFCMQKGGCIDGCCCCKARFDDDAFLREELALRQQEEVHGAATSDVNSSNRDGAGGGEGKTNETVESRKSNGATGHSRKSSQPEGKEPMSVPADRRSKDVVNELREV